MVVIVLVSTAIWALAFHSIYLRQEPRMAASRWIFQNIPAPIDINIETVDKGLYNEPLAFPTDMVIQPGAHYSTTFNEFRDGKIYGVTLGHVLDSRDALSAIEVYVYAATEPDV